MYTLTYVRKGKKQTLSWLNRIVFISFRANCRVVQKSLIRDEVTTSSFM